jgi:ABC-type multidrug transport system ATPase subunit
MSLAASFPRNFESAVRARKLTKLFGATMAVDDLTFEVASGAVFGLIGPNGAGKSTTFSMLAGYLRPSSGSVEILGLAPTAVDALRGRVGVLPQDAVLPASDRVGEFLLHMARLQGMAESRVLEGAQRALDDVSGRDWWNERCGNLSHGMAKRVVLAQAFLGDPEVVLLDEPTAGLDPRIAWEIRQSILAKKGRCSIIISSHNLNELEEICDAAAVIDRGRLVATGSMAELTATQEEIRVKVAPATSGARGNQVPLQALRELADVKTVDLDEDRLEIIVRFDRNRADAETIIGRVLKLLLDQQVRISGVTKGRGLEKRVMEIT